MVEFLRCSPSFSFFDLIERLLPLERSRQAGPLHRLCTLLRRMGARTLILEDARLAPDVVTELSLLSDAFGLDRRSKAYKLSFFSCEASEHNLSQTPQEEFLGQFTLIQYKPKRRRLPVCYIVEAIIRPPKFAVEEFGVSNERLNNFISLEKAFRRKVLNTEFSLSGVYFCQQNGLTSGCGHAALRMWLNSIGYAEDTITTDWLMRVGGIAPGISFTLEQLTEAVEKRGWKPLVMNCKNIHASVYLRSMHSILASGYPALIIFRTASGDEHVVTAFGYTHNPDEWRSEGVNAYLRSAPIVPYYPSTQWVDHFLVHDDNVGPYYTIDTSTLMDLKVSTVIGLTPPDVRSYPAMVEMAAAEALKSILGQVPDSVWGRRLQRYPLILRTTLRSREEYRSHLKNLVGYDTSRLTPDELTWVDTLPEKFWMTEFTFSPLFTGNRSKLGEVITSVEEFDSVPDQVLSLRLPGAVYLTRGSGMPLDIRVLQLASHAPMLLAADVSARNSTPSLVPGNLQAAQS